MSAAVFFGDADDVRQHTFCGRPLGAYSHDELVQLLAQAIIGPPENLGTLVNMAKAFNARRRADDLITGLPFITRRKGGGHDTAAR